MLAGYDFEKEHPKPDETPEGSLRHVLDVFADEADDRHIVTATRNVYGPGVVTGLTYGNLRALAKKLGI